MKNIIKDLEDRELLIVSFIVETKDKKMQVISYDEKELVTSITDKFDALDIYSPSLVDNTAIPVLNYRLKNYET